MFKITNFALCSNFWIIIYECGLLCFPIERHERGRANTSLLKAIISVGQSCLNWMQNEEEERGPAHGQIALLKHTAWRHTRPKLPETAVRDELMLNDADVQFGGKQYREGIYLRADAPDNV